MIRSFLWLRMPAAVLALSGMVSGCSTATYDPDNGNNKNKRMSISGTYQAISSEGTTSVSLAPLVCNYLPEGSRDKLDKVSTSVSNNKCFNVTETEANVATVLAEFAMCYGNEGHALATSSACQAKDKIPDEASVLIKAGLRMADAVAGITGLTASISGKEGALAAADASAKGINNTAPPASEAAQITKLINGIPKEDDLVAAVNAVNAASRSASLAIAGLPAGTLAPGAYGDTAMKVANVGIAMDVAAGRAHALSKALEAAGADAEALRAKLKAKDDPKTVEATVNTIGKIVAAKALANEIHLRSKSGAAMLGGGIGAGVLARTAIQEEIVMAADRRCEAYKLMLADAKSHVDFYAATLGSFAGLAGSGVSGVASRVLSGIAGGSSAFRSAYDDTFFQGQMIDLIIYGIDTARGDWRTNVFATKRTASLADYSLQEAIQHAMQYNGLCSMAASLHQVQDKLKNPVDIDKALKHKKLAEYRDTCTNKAIHNDKGAAQQRTEIEACEEAAGKYAKALGLEQAANGNGSPAKTAK